MHICQATITRKVLSKKAQTNQSLRLETNLSAMGGKGSGRRSSGRREKPSSLFLACTFVPLLPPVSTDRLPRAYRSQDMHQIAPPL